MKLFRHLPCVRLASIAMIGGLLCACGQRGPLYLPEKSQAPTRAAPVAPLNPVAPVVPVVPSSNSFIEHSSARAQ